MEIVEECIAEWERTNAPGANGKGEVIVPNFLDHALKAGLFVRYRIIDFCLGGADSPLFYDVFRR